MKNVLLLLVISASLMSAQTYNQIQFGWAYDFTHYNKLTTGTSPSCSISEIVAICPITQWNATNWNGYNANFIYAPAPHFGVEVKSGTSWTTGTGCGPTLPGFAPCADHKLRMYQIAAGPQFQIPGNSRITPYAHVLLGGTYGSGHALSGDLRGLTVIPGAGFRVQLARHVAFTTGVDYQYARLHYSTLSGTNFTGNGFRASAGVLVTLLERPAGSRTAFNGTPTKNLPKKANDCYESGIGERSVLDCHGNLKQ